jgi:hypothetical protein
MGIEGEVIQTKGINNLINNIIAENFPNLEREGNPDTRSLQITKPSGLEKKHPQTYHNPIIQYTEKRKITESSKREKTSYV